MRAPRRARLPRDGGGTPRAGGPLEGAGGAVARAQPGPRRLGVAVGDAVARPQASGVANEVRARAACRPRGGVWRRGGRSGVGVWLSGAPRGRRRALCRVGGAQARAQALDRALTSARRAPKRPPLRAACCPLGALPRGRGACV